MNSLGANLLSMLLVSVVTTGCATQGGLMPLSDTQINAAGELVEVPVGATRDASVAKEHEVHKTLRNRDLQYRKAYAESGFSMTYEQHEINGVVVMLPAVSFKETPRFEQPLPTRPSEHPVWNFAGKALDRGLAAFGIDRLYRFGKSAVEGAGDHRVYQGDYAPYQSGNPGTFTGDGAMYQPYTVEPEVVHPEVVMPEVFGPASLLKKE